MPETATAVCQRPLFPRYPGGQAVVLRQRRALLRHDVEAEDRVAVQLAGGHLPHLAGARAARGDAP